jgi:hypothetical protein
MPSFVQAYVRKVYTQESYCSISVFKKYQRNSLLYSSSAAVFSESVLHLRQTACEPRLVICVTVYCLLHQ